MDNGMLIKTPISDACTKKWNILYRCRKHGETPYYIFKKKGKSKYNRRCRVCHEAAGAKWSEEHKFARWKIHMKSKMPGKYGITLQEYLGMWQEQNGLCKICNKPSKKVRLGIDHCHKTNKIRGLLCNSCNSGLGLFQDDSKILALAIKYLDGAQSI